MEITGHYIREIFDHYNTVDKDDTRNAIEQLKAFRVNVYQNLDQTKKNRSFPFREITY